MLMYLFLLLFLAAAAFFAYVWFAPMDEHDIFDFVPQDAVYVLEADDPIENWKAFSDTKIWKHLKENELFGEITGSANYLDTLVNDHKKLFKLISGKKLVIVAHMTKSDDYDFIYLMDLKKGAKVSFFMDIFKPILNTIGVTMTRKDIGENEVYGIGEGEDEIFLAFKDNILISSYSKKLLINSLQQHQRPYYSRNGSFNALRRKAYKLENRESLMKLHLNFDQLDEMMSVYMDEVTETVISLSKIMEYSCFDVKMEDKHAQMSGYTSIDDTDPSLLSVMQDIRTSEIRSHQILPANTSFMLTINYHDFDYFYEQIQLLMEDDEGFKEFEKTKDQIGGFLGVKKKDKKVERKRRRGKDVEYFDWIGEEIGLAMVPVNESGSKQAYVAIFHSPDKENSEHDLKEIEKKIRNRTPVRFKQYDYKGHEISYLKLKGFFKLFMGKLFKKFDKPKYVILDDFVIFSNDTTAIHRTIDVANGNLTNLPMRREFRSFMKQFEPESNYFLYVNTLSLFPYLPSLGDAETARSLRKNEKYITCFPQAGLQLLSEDGVFRSELYLEFEKEKKGGLFGL